MFPPHHAHVVVLRRNCSAGHGFLDNGKGVTSAGIDAALHVVAKLLGQEQAEKTTRYVEYDWQPVAS